MFFHKSEWNRLCAKKEKAMGRESERDKKKCCTKSKK